MSLFEIFRNAGKKEVMIWLQSMEYQIEKTATALEGIKVKRILKYLKK